jgi:hypothetical protein
MLLAFMVNRSFDSGRVAMPSGWWSSAGDAWSGCSLGGSTFMAMIILILAFACASLLGGYLLLVWMLREPGEEMSEFAPRGQVQSLFASLSWHALWRWIQQRPLLLTHRHDERARVRNVL